MIVPMLDMNGEFTQITGKKILPNSYKERFHIGLPHMFKHKRLNRKTSILGAYATIVAVALGTAALTNAYAHGGGGNEGCTPGFWKNHPELVAAIVIPGFDGKTATQVTVNEYFGTNLPSQYGDLTLAEAVTLKGSTDITQLVRQAVSAVFNSLTIDSFYADHEIRAMFRDAIDPNYQQFAGIPDDDDLEEIKDLLDTANNLGCPL